MSSILERPSCAGMGVAARPSITARRESRARGVPTLWAVPHLPPRADATDSSANGYALPTYRVREFARIAARYGWDIRAIVATAGIELTSLDQPCPGITMARAVGAWRRLRAVTSDEFLGVGPHPVSPDKLRCLAFAISGANTVGDALGRLEQFAPVVGGLPMITVISGHGQTTVAFDLDGFDSQLSLVTDSVLAVTHRLINWGTRRRVRLMSVDAPYQRPHGESDHDLVYGVPVNYGATRAALTFSSSVLDLPVMRRHEEIEAFLSDIPAVLLSDFDFYSTYTQRVRGIIERCLGDHVCAAEEIAAGMGISRQTLRRRLQEENTSVSAIRDEVLRTAALEGLAQGGETVSALASRLGFSEPSAFTRAFRRWTGESPTVFLRRRAEAS
jgi:AraC-like DNA-binding protein